jgi:hypothetical protein
VTLLFLAGLTSGNVPDFCTACTSSIYAISRDQRDGSGDAYVRSSSAKIGLANDFLIN